MNVIAEIGLGSNGIENVVAHILGIGSSEAHPHIGHSPRHLCQELGERNAIVGPLAIGQQTIGIDILTKECHFLEAFIVKIPHLAENALHVARPLTATGVGNDAIMTEVVAATHDADEARHTIGP